MKRTIVVFLIILGSVASVSAQPARTKVPPKLEEKVIALETDDPAQSFAEKGVLPEPFIIGRKPSDELAANLAREISKYDENSLPLLLGALQKAGFYIIDEKHKTLYKPTVTDDAGMAFYDFEVVGMLKGSRLGMVTSVKKLAAAISNNDAQMNSELIAASLLEDLQAARNSSHPKIRFIAALVFELGKQFPTPVDLGTVTPENATLNLIQASLMERVLLGDLIDAYTKIAEADAFYRKPEWFAAPRDVQFLNAGFAPRRRDACDMISDISTLQKTEKTVYKTIEQALTYKKSIEQGIDATGKVKVAKLPITLQKQYLEKYGNGLKYANIALAWTKLIASLYSVKIEVTVEDPMPLVRTKSGRNPGETRTVKAAFTMDILDKKKTDFVNCVGKAFEVASGVKFSVPKAGSMKDKPVGWELLADGAGYQKYLDTPVYLDALDRSDTSKQKSDVNGESQVKLTGKPQRKDLTSAKAVPVPKQVDLRVSVALEKMDLGEDGSKIGKMILSDMGVGIIGDIIGMLPDMLGKMKLSSKTVQIPVRDWEPCSEDWGGYINVKHELVQTTVIKASRQSNGNSTGDGIRRLSVLNEARVTLNPRKPEEMATKSFSNPAQILVSGKTSDITELTREADPCCGKKEGDYYVRTREGKEMSYSKILSKLVPITYRARERDYELGFEVSTDTFLVKWRNFKETITNCPIEDDNHSEELESFYQFNFNLSSGRYGQRLVNPEGELLYGTKEVDFPDGSKFTWNWALARCRN